MISVDDATSLSQLFHLNSEPWLNEAAYRSTPYHHEFWTFADAARTALPPSAPGAVRSLASSRSSARAFAPGPLPLTLLAEVVRAAYGIIGLSPMDGGGVFLRRTVPSAGGMYPLELVLMLRRVPGVADGTYHFDPRGEELERISADDWTIAAPGMFYTWPFIEDANCILCLCADFARSQKKYGPRGYRYILLEAGHVAQNLCLAAEEAGLATLCMGGFRDHLLNRALGLKAPGQGAVYAVALGAGARGDDAAPLTG